MSTRCHIAVYEGEDHTRWWSNLAAMPPGLLRPSGNWVALIYQHSDGYPQGVLPSIVPFVRHFLAIRGFDSEYLAARLLQHLANEYDRGMDEFWAKSPEGRGPNREREVLGFGISKSLHGDIRWFYAITPSALWVYEREYVEGDYEILKFKLHQKLEWSDDNLDAPGILERLAETGESTGLPVPPGGPNRASERFRKRVQPRSPGSPPARGKPQLNPGTHKPWWEKLD